MTTNTPSPSFARRHRRGLTISGIIAGAVVVASVGSYGVLRAMPAEFPLVYSETLAAGVTDGVSVADPATALTFARVDTGNGPTVLAVTDYRNNQITGVDINAAAGTAFTEPIAAFNALGYDAVATIASDTTLPPIVVAPSDVLTSLDTHSHHIGTGTNYVEHQEESTIEEPFLFPKIAAPTDSNDTLPVGEGLLDYEVELGIVPLADRESVV
jgi:2,4-diketo-3-deoxy-L-fuconate hydrolase